MEKDSTKALSNVIRIYDERIHVHLGKGVRGTIEMTLNALLEAEVDRLYGAESCKCAGSRQKYGFSFRQALLTKDNQAEMAKDATWDADHD